MAITKKRKSLFDFITFLITVSCACLAVWSINIYRNTIIDWKILVPPVIIGIVFFLVSFWRILLNFGYKLWAILFICSICGGCLAHFGTMYLNQKFSRTETTTETYTIERKGTLAKGRSGCNEPYAVINFDGLEKELIFNCDISDIIYKYSKVKISYSKGFLGYYVIKGRTLQE